MKLHNVLFDKRTQLTIIVEKVMHVEEFNECFFNYNLHALNSNKSFFSFIWIEIWKNFFVGKVLIEWMMAVFIYENRSKLQFCYYSEASCYLFSTRLPIVHYWSYEFHQWLCIEQATIEHRKYAKMQAMFNVFNTK